jgi:hypothetical protein
MKGSIHALLFILLTAFVSCNRDSSSGRGGKVLSEEKHPGNDQEVSLVMKRFEQDLFAIRKESFQADTLRMRKKYGDFMDLYFSRIIKIGSTNNPLFQQNLDGFLNDPDIRSVSQSVTTRFADLGAEQNKLMNAFDIYKKLFPDSLTPDVYTMISGFSYNIVTTDSALGIGLDMYLGTDSRYYELLGLPKYKSDQMHRARIVPDAIRAYLLASWEMPDPYQDLVTRMIYHGKILYLSSLMLPDLPESELLGYTEKQWAWCKKEEARIWGHFIDRKLFYSTDFNDEVAYMNDGPFTKGFPPEAPARIGAWLGLQLVKSFMEKNEVELKDLMKEKDARIIFSKSKYKPERS